MAFTFEGWSINEVAVLDDDDDGRHTTMGDLELASFAPRPVEGPFANEDLLIETITSSSSAAVCDHHLLNYAPCSGAKAVNRLYEARFPAVLVTTYFKADIDQIRRFRRNIPALLTPDETSADPDSIAKGFEQCIREFCGNFSPLRRPWRTLVCVEDVSGRQEDPMVYVFLPGWNSSEKVRFPRSIMPNNLHDHVLPGARFFAKVNKGAEDQSELYFEEFELCGR
jgi:hypothetical protein